MSPWERLWLAGGVQHSPQDTASLEAYTCVRLQAGPDTLDGHVFDDRSGAGPERLPPEARAVEQVGIRQLRAELAAATRRAGAGERMVITVDGRPVAQLGPLEPTDSEPTLADLAARGLLVPARRGDRPPPEIAMPMWAGTRIDQLLREVRGR